MNAAMVNLRLNRRAIRSLRVCLYLSPNSKNIQALIVTLKSPGNAQKKRLALYMGHMPTNNPLTLYYLSLPLVKNIMLTH